jgi:flavin reductase (DIM6/NTAB) family NADH-FMN oxidoreductase RutF
MTLAVQEHSASEQGACKPFSAREFRDVLGLFATGVAVITGKAQDGSLLGATVSSFSSVSLDPPLILFSIARSAKAFSAWEAVDAFSVNILAEDQSDTSTRFARAMTDKWQGVEARVAANGTPLLPGALAWLECTSYAKYDGGDHLIFVGRVDLMAARKVSDARPLVFFRGQYRQLAFETLLKTPPETEYWLHGW